MTSNIILVCIQPNTTLLNGRLRSQKWRAASQNPFSAEDGDHADDEDGSPFNDADLVEAGLQLSRSINKARSLIQKNHLDLSDSDSDPDLQFDVDDNIVEEADDDGQIDDDGEPVGHDEGE